MQVDSFIVCGVLYAVERDNRGDLGITLAVDLYRNQVLKPDIKFTTAYGQISMLSYNPRLEVCTRNDMCMMQLYFVLG